MQKLDKIAIFVRAMDAGSFTRAARFLKQPKSRVARNVAALEQELGVNLIYRTTRQFSPTEAGIELYKRCRELVYALESASQDLKSQSNEIRGKLRITAADDFGSMLLGPIVAELSTLHPELCVDLVLSNEYVDLVKDGVDLAVRIGELQDIGLKSRLISQTFMMLVASPEYLKKAKPLEKLSDLASHPVLFFDVEANSASAPIWEMVSKSGRIESVRVFPICSANNPKVLLDLALLGKGVAYLPDFLCLDALENRKLKRVLPNYSSEKIPIHFVWPAQRETSPKVRAFIDLTLKRLSNLQKPAVGIKYKP